MAATRRKAVLAPGASSPERARVYHFRVVLDKPLRDWLVIQAHLAQCELGNKIGGSMFLNVKGEF